jgi:hypothetical protein
MPNIPGPIGLGVCPFHNFVILPGPDYFSAPRHVQHAIAVPDTVFKSPRKFMAGGIYHGPLTVQTVAFDAIITKGIQRTKTDYQQDYNKDFFHF